MSAKRLAKLIKKFPYLFPLLVGGLSGFFLTQHYYDTPHSHRIPQEEGEEIKLFFSPKGECAQRIIETINQAKETIYIAIYVFTHEDIAHALLDAQKRGVDIHILADNAQANKKRKGDKPSILSMLHQNGIAVYIDRRPGVMHHKWLIADQETIITGSYNYSQNAENKNNEIIGICKSPQVAKRYYQDWQKNIEAKGVSRSGELNPKK